MRGRLTEAKTSSVSFRNGAASVCLAIPALVEVGLGVVYSSASSVMPYHEQALGQDWAQLAPRLRTMLLTLVNEYGSAHLGIGIALLSLLFFSLRQGHAWARWVILALGFPVLGATALLSYRLAASTGAGVPWPGAVVLLLLFLAGVAMADPRAAARRVEASDFDGAPPVVGG